jgi:hypothetical protein
VKLLQEAQGADHLAQGAGRGLALLTQVDQVVADLGATELAWTTTMEAGKLGHAVDIAGLGAWRQVAHPHVLDHPLA